jgi:alpha-glucosidase
MTRATPGAAPESALQRPRDWWRDAVVYQVYPRSFADSDGDGMGDIPGLIGRLDYLADLGVDAVWISPFYSSPLHDGGYDVANYRSIDSRLGSLTDVDDLIAQAHARGMRVIMDIVPNHSSSEHPWFQEALTAGPGSAAWDRYVIREGRGEGHEEPPNNWRSVFHGRGWSRMPDAEGNPTGYWYLHLFDTTQPDLNWENPEVHEEFRDILRFWFDRGIDGFRIDVAHGLVKEAGLPDFDHPEAGSGLPGFDGDEQAPELMFDSDHAHAPYWDQDGVHDIYREWRAVADEYDPPRVFCGETWVPNPERLARYQRPDELHTSFNFSYLEAGWDAEAMRSSIDATIANHATVGAPPTWVLSNHDVVRHRTRLAPITDGAADLERGLSRARAATLFTLGLPGSLYLYQGEELGLHEVSDLPDEARQDPAWHRSGGTDGRRDGCRVPIPWSGAAPSFGFNDTGASWLPMPATWAGLSVAEESGVDGSTLEMYRAALRIRREEAALGEGPLEWLNAPEGVLAYRRPAAEDVIVVLNLGDAPVRLPAAWGTDVLMGSGDAIAVLDDDGEEIVVIGGEISVWLRG